MKSKHARAYRAAERELWHRVGVSPTERTVRLDGWGTSLRVQEVGQGEPVLFVHGGPNAGTKWAPMLPRLSGFRCLLLDRPGTGLSEPLPRRLGRDDLLDFADTFVADVLDALELERAHVVASSLGGFIALRSAAAHPGRVDRMVQMSCPALADGMRTPPFLRAATLPVVGGLLRRMPASRRGNVMAMRQMGHGATIDAAAMPVGYDEWYLAVQRFTDTLTHDGRLIAAATTLRGFDRRLTLGADVLAAVEAPTRFIWGADDGFGGPDVGQRLTAQMSHADLHVLERCGHLPWLDRPDHVADLVGEWLTSSHVVTDAPSPRSAATGPMSSFDVVSRRSVGPRPSVVPTLSPHVGLASSVAVAAALLSLTACGSDLARADRPAEVTVPSESTAAAPTITVLVTTASTTTTPPASTPPPSTTTASTAPPPAPSTSVHSEFTVTAVDFGFEGVPSELPAGEYTMHFTNDGAELHELLIYRNPDALTPEEIHHLGPAGAVERIEVVGIVFAEPGQPAPEPIVATLTAGEYEVICFIPTPLDSRPHFAHGMHTAFTVV